MPIINLSPTGGQQEPTSTAVGSHEDGQQDSLQRQKTTLEANQAWSVEEAVTTGMDCV